MHKYKITLLGDGAVGKTSLRKKFMGDGFKHNYAMTIGADFAAYRIADYTLHIWDIAGQARFNTLISSYYVGTLGSLIVFDITRKESYMNVPKWVDGLYSNLKNKKVPIVLVGNKTDLRPSDPNSIDPTVPEQYAKELSEWTGFEVPYIETSALNGENVHDAFMHLISAIDDTMKIKRK